MKTRFHVTFESGTHKVLTTFAQELIHNGYAFSYSVVNGFHVSVPQLPTSEWHFKSLLLKYNASVVAEEQKQMQMQIVKV